jgi:hypothetical protein
MRPKGTMAAKKKAGGSGKKKGSSRRGNPGHKKPRRGRRRNPGTFLSNLGNLSLGAGVALLAGVGVLAAQSRISPGSPASLYGAPAAALLLGAVVAKKAPTIGAGIAIGGIVGPFALPVATKMLGAPASSPAQAAALAAVQLGAITMGDYEDLLQPDTMYDVGAVQMGSHRRAYN